VIVEVIGLGMTRQNNSSSSSVVISLPLMMVCRAQPEPYVPIYLTSLDFHLSQTNFLNSARLLDAFEK
jgi:hypothetical protein